SPPLTSFSASSGVTPELTQIGVFCKKGLYVATMSCGVPRFLPSMKKPRCIGRGRRMTAPWCRRPSEDSFFE
ncbi:unnamed protein product, partial [Mycena citricolor]